MYSVQCMIKTFLAKKKLKVIYIFMNISTYLQLYVELWIYIIKQS